MHFRILKMFVTSGFLTALECTESKSFLAGALPRTPLGELTALPSPRSWFKGALILRAWSERRRKVLRKGREERKRERERNGRDG